MTTKWLQPSRGPQTQLAGRRKHTIAEICHVMGISKSTLYSYLDKAQRDAGAQR